MYYCLVTIILVTISNAICFGDSYEYYMDNIMYLQKSNLSWSVLLIRLLIIGQACMLVSVSMDAFTDLLSSNTWLLDNDLSLDGYSDLVNEVYWIMYFLAYYIVYLVLLLLSLTVHDFDNDLLLLVECLKKSLHTFSKLSTITYLSKLFYSRIKHNPLFIKTNQFCLLQAEEASSYLPFV